MPIEKESWYVYAKEKGITKAKAQEYWNIAKEEGKEDWEKVFGIFKKIIDNSLKEAFMENSRYPLYLDHLQKVENLLNSIQGYDVTNVKEYRKVEDLVFKLNFFKVLDIPKEVANKIVFIVNNFELPRKNEAEIKKLTKIFNISVVQSLQINWNDSIIKTIEYLQEVIKILPTKIEESYMSRLDYSIKEEKEEKEKKDKASEEKRLAPFIGYAENEGIEKDQATAIFYSVRGGVAKDNKVDTDDFESEDLAELWKDYKEAIKKAKDGKDKKKESITLSKSCVLEGTSIKKGANIIIKEI